MSAADRRRALARDGVLTGLKTSRWRLPYLVRHAIADAVLAAIAPELEHCTHSRAVHDEHHTETAAGCPWCADPATPATVPTGGLT